VGVFEIRLDLRGEGKGDRVAREKEGGAYVRYSVRNGQVDDGIMS